MFASQRVRNASLDEIGNVERHLVDLGRVELLNVTEHTHVIARDKVDGNTLTTETTTTADTVNVVLPVAGKIVVDDQRNLLHVDTTSEQVGGDQDTRRARAELAHDDLTLRLLHVAVHGRDGELTRSELVGQPVDLSASVAEDDGLGDGDGLVEIAKRVELPLLLFDGNVELLDTFQGQLVTLDENADGVAHELFGDLENLLRHGSREQDTLGVLGQELEDLVHLVLETTREHLVGLVEAEHLELVRLESTTVDHVVDTTGSADDDLGALIELGHVLTNVGTTDAGVAVDLHVVAECDDDLLDLLGELTSGGKDERLDGLDARVDALQNGDREGGGLAGTGLSLSNHIVTLDDGDDSTRLNRRGTLETVGVDTTEKLLLELHVVKVVNDGLPVGLDLAIGDVEVVASLASRGSGGGGSVLGPVLE